MDKLSIIYLPGSDLVPNDWNPNEMSPDKFDLLRQRIRTKGFRGVIWVRVHPKLEKKWEIIDGEQKWRAGSLEGMKEFPCIVESGTEDSEAQFETFVMNYIHGEINEVKLAVLIQNWRKMSITPDAIFAQTGLRAHKQASLINKLRPVNISEAAMNTVHPGQHRSFAVILSDEEHETLTRALKLTRLSKDVDRFLEIVDYYLDRHSLTQEQGEVLKKLLSGLKGEGDDAEALTQIASFYLSNVTPAEIRREGKR